LVVEMVLLPTLMTVGGDPAATAAAVAATAATARSRPPILCWSNFPPHHKAFLFAAAFSRTLGELDTSGVTVNHLCPFGRVALG
jgi:hypothetical protein